MANTARWIATNFSSRSKRAVVNQYSGAPVHACPDFAMSRGNYLWERCGTVRCGFYRGYPSYPTRIREIREFLISLLPRLPYEFDRIRVRCTGKKARPPRETRRPHTRPDFRSSWNYFGNLSSARYARNCGRIREHPPWDFHYQRQRRRGPPCSG